MNHKNKKKQWGVVLGNPTERHTCAAACKSLIGMWQGENGPLFVPEKLYFTKGEAEKAAVERAKENTHWNYHAKKYNPREKQE